MRRSSFPQRLPRPAIIAPQRPQSGDFGDFFIRGTSGSADLTQVSRRAAPGTKRVQAPSRSERRRYCHAYACPWRTHDDLSALTEPPDAARHRAGRGTLATHRGSDGPHLGTADREVRARPGPTGPHTQRRSRTSTTRNDPPRTSQERARSRVPEGFCVSACERRGISAKVRTRAGLAQLVERDLPKVEAVGSNPIARFFQAANLAAFSFLRRSRESCRLLLCAQLDPRIHLAQ